jgi:hypothetical protein
LGEGGDGGGEHGEVSRKLLQEVGSGECRDKGEECVAGGKETESCGIAILLR